MSKFQIGLFIIGMGIGLALPRLPAPLNVLDNWLWILFLIIGVILMIKGS